MITEETCPECGGRLLNEVICTYPPIPAKRCLKCGWSWEGKQEVVKPVRFDPPDEGDMKDITYCSNISCPFNDCDRHPKQLKGKAGIASFADFAGTCRRYISWLVDEVKEDQERG